MQISDEKQIATGMQEQVHDVEASFHYVGAPVKRVEDKRLLTGRDKFIDNIKIPKMVYAGFVRSPYAHAKIKSINLSRIQGNASVVAILTPDEVRQVSEPIPVLWRVPHSKIHEHYSLAQGKVLHVGDPVVAVAVNEKSKLEDILELVEVEYEVLEPVVDTLSAEGRPPIHEELGTNVCFAIPIVNGDVEKAIEEAHAVVSAEFKISRLAASPMETRGIMADPNGLLSELTIYSSTQWPHVLRTHLSSCLRMDENRIRVIGPDVGGAFGVKGEIYAEEVAVSLLALQSGLPVKWIESRKESFLATTHARDQIIQATASFLEDGTLSALKVNLVCDFGAYLHTITAGSGFITAISMNGPYRIPNLSVTAKGVYTNKVSLSAYRGYGQPEAAFTIERLMSMGAEKLGIDPSEVRFKNLVTPPEMPYKNATGGMYDSGDYPSCLRKALDIADYDGMTQRKAAAKSKGKLRGIGISVFTETTGFAPGFVFSLLGVQLGGYDSATVKIDPHGRAAISTGAFPHGQGFSTTLSQICSDELGLDMKDVYSHHGDTHSSPYGQGSFGSRSIAVAGSAAVLACRKVKEKILNLAAYVLKVDSKDLLLANGVIKSITTPDKSISIAKIAEIAYRAHDIPKDMEPALEATVFFQAAGLATSYAAHVAEVDVDKETGKVKILKYVSVHDCGKEINPMIVEGQIQGSVVQAIGASLTEELVYDSSGQLLNGSFMDYILPTSEFAPELIVGSTKVPTPINPLGAKGIGESGTIIGPPAIANAVSDAIGVQMNLIPMTPERVWSALHKSA